MSLRDGSVKQKLSQKPRKGREGNKSSGGTKRLRTAPFLWDPSPPAPVPAAPKARQVRSSPGTDSPRLILPGARPGLGGR
ncbi:hypothetical protein DV515_00018398 [Chloebia gouldiae]|uniref:Uncharacterized protein n=1 Tax=Chloebia gouldiae TaxID=44316 RepID=A0A3L8Q802_CHLGU|nr:hypothetical protein DV515_00018398 [Chloebia gouldiae]